jgi:hypothetical protein
MKKVIIAAAAVGMLVYLAWLIPFLIGFLAKQT